MHNLPLGVYAVSQAFTGQSGEVTFTFHGKVYCATLGKNAFTSLDDLTNLDLVKPKQPFCGYGDTPIILIPAGVLTLGNAPEKAAKFNTFMPCAVTILGENAGISPNETDLRTPARRNEESVLQGSFYFGCINIGGEKDGVLTVDGVTLGAKLYDTRTGGKNAGLTLRNSIITTLVPYTIVLASSAFRGQRMLTVSDCRTDGIDSFANEGCLVSACSGSVTVERLYMANTRKFLGMTNYVHAQVNAVQQVVFRDSLFENCRSTHGLTVNLPPESKANILVDGCRFLDFVPEDDPVITAILPTGSHLTVVNTVFAGKNTAPAVFVDGDLSRVVLDNVTETGFNRLCAEKPARRSEPCENAEYPVTDPHRETKADFTALERLYAGKNVYYGDFHCHSNSGGTSDGKAPIETFAQDMQEKQLDFAAIVDHKQMRHFFLDCWDERCMICGSEPSVSLDEPSRPMPARKMDYTMIFPDKTGLKKTLEAFPEFAFRGTELEGSFRYYSFTLKRFRELADYIYSIGGLLSHAHPKQLMSSEVPMDYYIGENVPLETVHGSPATFGTRQNRDLWVALLNLGKRVRTHGSSDSHGPVSNSGLTALYAAKHHSTEFFNVVRSGDCTAGGVAVRMCIADTPMGGETAYAPDKTLLISVDGFHPAHWKPDTVYCLKVYTNRGLAYAREFQNAPLKLALDVEKRSYYRVEITNESDGVPVALTNPIWFD